MSNSLFDDFNKLFNQNIVEYKTLSKTSQMLSDNVNTQQIRINDAKTQLYLLRVQLIGNFYKAFLILTSNCWKVIGIMILTLVLLAGCSYFAYCILSTLYKDIHQLLYWSVKYSFAKNVNIMYTLSALFSAFSLYIWISILGIKKFFGTIFDKISNKIIDKVESKI